MTSPSFRQFRKLVYALKRQYPTFDLQLCRTENDLTNYATGIKTYSLIVSTIRRVVVLPSKDLRRAMHTATDISRKQDFAFGGFFDTRTKAIIISQRDIPSDFPIDMNMFIVLGGLRWEVKALEETESKEYLVVTAQELDGSVNPPIPTPPLIPPAIIAPSNVAFIIYSPTGATLDASGSGKIFATVGATGEADFLLPAWQQGLQFAFNNATNNLVRVVAHGTDVIQDGGSITTPGGNMDNSGQGSMIQVTAISTGAWTVTFSIRMWNAN